ncbi:MAG: four helix bundle protein [Saprospiraceae bacterium]|nr:four helix bundle protein [Saprospiraceae bacterium]
MEEYKYNFEKLEIWNLAIDLSVDIYKITTKFPEEEKYGIISQLRRASSSISANIAEGSTRLSDKDKGRFIQIAFGSTIEVLNFLILSARLDYISNEELEYYRINISKLSNKINSYYKFVVN